MGPSTSTRGSLEQPQTEVNDEEALDLAYAHRPGCEPRGPGARDIEDQGDREGLPAKLTLNSNVTGRLDLSVQESWNSAWSPFRLQRRAHHGEVGEAKANSRTCGDRGRTRNNVTLEVQQSLLNLGQSAESSCVADKGCKQSRENLSLAEGRYKTGVGNIIELTDAQVSLVAAERAAYRRWSATGPRSPPSERSTAHRFRERTDT